MITVSRTFEAKILGKLKADMRDEVHLDLERSTGLKFLASIDSNVCFHGVTRRHMLSIKLPGLSAFTASKILELLVRYDNVENFSIVACGFRWSMNGDARLVDGTFETTINRWEIGNGR